MKKYENSKKILRNLTVLLLTVTLLPGLAAAEEGVSRNIYPHPPSDFDVTLTIHNISIAGIVETLPDDVSFISTTQPSDRIRVSGQKIAFALINDTSITYRVRSMSGIPAIAGIWEDFLKGVNGTINGGAEHSGSTPLAQKTPAQKSVPGFEALLLIAVLLHRSKR